MESGINLYDENFQYFLEESMEDLDRLAMDLLQLEQSPQDLDLVNSIFRVLHTIKGNSKMFNLIVIQEFSHEVETVFDLIRKDQFSVTKEVIDLTLAASDHLQKLFNDLKAGILNDGKEGLLILEGFENLFPKQSSLKSKNERVLHIHISPEPTIFEGALVDPILLLNNVIQLGNQCQVEADIAPLLNELEKGLDSFDPSQCYISWDLYLTTKVDPQAIEDQFCFEEKFHLEITTKEPVLNDDIKTSTGDTLILTSETLDFLTSDKIFEKIDHLTQKELLILDCSQLYKMTSMGIGVIVHLAKELNKKGGTLKLVELPKRIYQYFEALHLDKIIEIQLKE